MKRENLFHIEAKEHDTECKMKYLSKENYFKFQATGHQETT